MIVRMRVGYLLFYCCTLCACHVVYQSLESVVVIEISHIAPCTIARWLKEVLKLSGFDTNIFTAHSTRSASSSAAADSGVTTSNILKAADWRSESVFKKFYYRPTHNPSYGRAVLSKGPNEA